MKKNVLLTGVAAACMAVFGLQGAQAQSSEPVVVYQAFQSIQYLPLYVAIDKGIFTKNGLTVQKITAGSGAAGVAAVIGGHADFSLQDPMTAMLANLKGASLINVANVVAGVPVWVIAPQDSPVRNLKDLNGKSVATALPPSTSTYLLQRLINDEKLADVKMNTVQIGTELAPVTAGRSEAAALYMPQAETGISQGYRIVYAFPKAYPGGYAFSTIDTLTSTIKNKPKMVEAFVKSIGEAEALIQQSHDTAKAVARTEFPSLDPKIVDSAVQRLIDQNIYAPTPEISEQAFKNALALQESIGNIKPGAITYASGVDNSFAAASVKAK
ncbi:MULTISPECIES: ABC transporter substrate-binding protein [unclassified Caballeronia]|uniref:ABC transporter substrate-binding protein n=1 Tax=unclassified Caballeronia TaxID=2646786 RepID=UPI001FCFAF50|nr:MULTISPECIES: ABC transporter substrate-binding protein [unclassified Caballeronia]MDR5806163.1 ABC transporter substrate-binding protein [Caballeronia sp. LZ001]